MTTNYISSVHDWASDKILAWERPVAGGERKAVFHEAPRFFYVPVEDGEEGEYTAIDGVKLKKLVFSSKDEYSNEVRRHRIKYESDLQPEARLLMEAYYGRPTPIAHYAFLDIEVDYSSKLGWSSPENPYAPINAITIFQSWTRKYLTYIVPPKWWDEKNGDALAEAVQAQCKELWKEHELDFTQDVTICKNERELLLYMLGDLEDADIISGWNSEFFDNPYIIKRLERVLGKRGPGYMCFKGAPEPREKIVNRFGSPAITYTLFGRTHLDYLDLFKKFTFEGRVSYSLANIAAEELEVPKLDYPGTLEQLYNGSLTPSVSGKTWARVLASREPDKLIHLSAQREVLLRELKRREANATVVDPDLAGLSDAMLRAKYNELDLTTKIYSFSLFTCYNARDVEVLVKLDHKFKLMQLANQMAHENTVPLTAILGTVRYVETGMMNYAHNVLKLIAFDKNVTGELNEKVEGAVVMTPRAGLWDWLAGVDINSLYPSTARALNMSIETYVGQFHEEERAWEGIRARDNNVWVALIGAETISATGNEWWEYLRAQNYAISGFGTIFDQNRPGVVASTLTFWFNERIRLQAKKKEFNNLAEAETDPIKKAQYLAEAEHYDLLQLTKKIQLNSAYGALLNEAFRFGRREIGASITGSGRQITKHMGQTIGRLASGKACIFEKRYGDFKNKSTRTGSFESGELYGEWLQAGNFEALRNLPLEQQWTRKFSKEKNAEVDVGSGAIWFTENPAIIYGDTDSCYFLTYANDYDEAVLVADDIAAQTNATFPIFMQEAFNCTEGREKLIKAVREVVAERGLFLHIKKKYTLRVVNLDGKDLRAKPKLKSMGSEIKKADTPKAVQDFLKELMDLILTGEKYPVLEKFINSHRGSLIGNTKDVLELATAKQVNNLDALYAEYKRTEKINNGKMKHCPGHVRSAINFNEMIEQFDSGGMQPLRAGDKASILYLNDNAYRITSIGFPSDMQHLPSWFTENFSVDLRKTEEKMIDSKVAGIFKALGYETPTLQMAHLKSSFTF